MACQKFGQGWKVNKNAKVNKRGAMICTKDETVPHDSCNDCQTWRMIVWKDGAHTDKNDKHYSTQAGKYYGGHQPCTAGDNYRSCGRWGPPWNGSFE